MPFWGAPREGRRRILELAAIAPTEPESSAQAAQNATKGDSSLTAERETGKHLSQDLDTLT